MALLTAFLLFVMMRLQRLPHAALSEVSASLRKAPQFLAEIGQPRIRRTEVRPMFSRRAISALLTPARYSFRTMPA